MSETVFKEINPVIPVRDMSSTLDFYEDKLGFRRVFDDGGSQGDAVSYAGVARGGLCLHLQSMTPGENPTMPLIRIRVENIDALFEACDAQGLVGPGGRLEPKPWGSRDFGIYDPNGAALVFYEDL